MAQTAKVIRIELRIGGGGGTSDSKSPDQQANQSLKSMDRKRALAGAGIITAATQLVSKGFSIAETLSYSSQEKTSLMLLDVGKKALSTAIITSGFKLGGPVGGAIGIALSGVVAKPIQQAGIETKRHFDQTRATNRFYQTNFASSGNMVFDNSKNIYINESLEKVYRGTCYKRKEVR